MRQPVNQMAYALMMLAGTLVFAGGAAGGDFVVKVFELDGVTAAEGRVTLKVIGTPVVRQTMNGEFGTVTAFPDASTGSDMTVRFEFYRPGQQTPVRVINGLNGASHLQSPAVTQIIHVNLPRAKK